MSTRREQRAEKKRAEVMSDREDVELSEFKQSLIVFGMFAVIISAVTIPMYYVEKSRQERMHNQRTEQLDKINKTCTGRGGVRSFNYGDGFVCNDGSAHNLKPIQ